MNNDEYENWTKKTLHNKSEILASEQVACLHCLKIFDQKMITEWADRDQTALCPVCRLDLIIPFDWREHEELFIIMKEFHKRAFPESKHDLRITG